MKQLKLSHKYKSIKDIFAYIDDDDYEVINKHQWMYNPKTGASRAERIKGNFPKKRSVYMHRLIMNAPKGMDVDHINHNRLDNRKCNLRVCTHQQNMQNRAKGGGMSKYKGVVFDKRPLNKPWISQITTNHKHHKLGYFKTELEAAKQYNCAARILFGQFALENKI